MKLKQALRKAVEIWGKTACVEGWGSDKEWEKRLARCPEKNRHLLTRYNVGCIMMGMFFEVCGTSNESWEKAFENAIERKLVPIKFQKSLSQSPKHEASELTKPTKEAV